MLKIITVYINILMPTKKYLKQQALYVYIIQGKYADHISRSFGTST